MKKLSLYIFLGLLWCNISYSQTIILFCSDIQIYGFDGRTGYSKTTKFKPINFKLKIDMNKKTILSKDLGGTFDTEDFVSCRHWPAFDKYDAMLECMSLGYYITINLNDYKYTRSRGYGHAFGNKDDIGTGYGTCEDFN